MGDFSSDLSLDIVNAERPFETDAASFNTHEVFIKTENLTEDHVMTFNCLSHVQSVNDVCQNGNMNTKMSSIEAYLLHKMEWEASSTTESDMLSNPISKVENLLKLETSSDDAYTYSWDKGVEHDVISGNGVPCHVTDDNGYIVEFLQESCCNNPSEYVPHASSFLVNTENSSCAAFLEDMMKNENPSLSVNLEYVKPGNSACSVSVVEDMKAEASTSAVTLDDVKADNLACTVTLESVKTEYSASVDLWEVEPAEKGHSLVHGSDQGIGPCSDKSPRNNGTGDLVTGVLMVRFLLKVLDHSVQP